MNISAMLQNANNLFSFVLQSPTAMLRGGLPLYLKNRLESKMF